MAINTHRGLYWYKRLPFGVASAPSIFQCTIKSILQGIPHVTVYTDDILITGTTPEEHLHNLEEVLGRLEKANIRLKLCKCAFFLPSVHYLGHRISAQGFQPLTGRVKAIQDAPAPRNVLQLKSFLGFLTTTTVSSCKPVQYTCPPLQTTPQECLLELGDRATSSFQTCKALSLIRQSAGTL